MKSRESSFFWTSYTDLMTTLFFVMLSLYVITVVTLKQQHRATLEQLKKITETKNATDDQGKAVETLKRQYKATLAQFKKIIEIQNATSGLDTNYFEYQEKYKRFSLRQQIQFRSESAVIPPDDSLYLITVGKSISRFVEDSLKVKYINDKIQYLIVIEGMASLDNYDYNDRLSYERALALKNLWIRNKVILDPKVCEVVIAGSGVNGAGRFPGTDPRNQRILIQIVPKIGRIEELSAQHN